MALSADDFTHPEGELDPEVYPKDTLDSDLDTWISQAQQETSDEEVQKHYVYGRAYGFICEHLQNQPSEAEAEEGTRYRRRMQQIRHFCSKASAYQDAFEEAVTGEEQGETWSTLSPDRGQDDTEYIREPSGDPSRL